MKISTVLIGPEETKFEEFEKSLIAFGNAVSTNRLPYYPDENETVRFLRANEPDILFISTEIPASMESVALKAIESFPNLQIVLVDSAARHDTLLRAMQLGVRECLTAPFATEDVRGSLERSMKRKAANPEAVNPASTLYTFLPARPGVGTTTLAVQAALSAPSDPSHRSLLIDADLEAGMIQFLLQLNNPYAFVEAIERVEQLDEHLWPQLVTEMGNLDILQAGDTGRQYSVDLSRLQFVLAFARRQYSTIFVDLPSAVNRVSTEMMNQSKTIFLVATPEVGALHMARMRLKQLEDIQLRPQVKLLVNRVDQKAKISEAEIAKAVGLPVHAVFTNNYAEVQRAVMEGGKLSEGSSLGRQIQGFASSLSRTPVKKERPKKWRFMEVFSLPR